MTANHPKTNKWANYWIYKNYLFISLMYTPLLIKIQNAISLYSTPGIRFESFMV
jgi:hypothetical protein